MKKICLLLVCFGLSHLFAADKPTPVTTIAPVIGHDLANSGGSVELLIQINSYGYVTDAKVMSSTDPRLNHACLAAIRQWRYTSGNHSGAAFVQSFRFGDDTIDTAPLASARPSPARRVSPEVPDDLSHISGEVTVGLEIDASGQVASAKVVKSTHEELNALTLSAAKQWTFTPAIQAGKPVACTIYVPFRYVGRETASAAIANSAPIENSQLIPLRQTSPQLPAELADAKGNAVIDITVDVHGYVSSATVKSASNAQLGEISRQTVLAWKFRPIVKNGAGIAVRAVQPFTFEGGSVTTVEVDHQPTIKKSVSPELPEELKGASGFAKVLFELDADGHVVEATVIDSSHEAFKAAVLAVAKSWTFHPAARAGHPVASRVTVPFVFGSKVASN